MQYIGVIFLWSMTIVSFLLPIHQKVQAFIIVQCCSFSWGCNQVVQSGLCGHLYITGCICGFNKLGICIHWRCSGLPETLKVKDTKDDCIVNRSSFQQPQCGQQRLLLKGKAQRALPILKGKSVDEAGICYSVFMLGWRKYFVHICIYFTQKHHSVHALTYCYRSLVLYSLRMAGMWG